ncbi:MAG: sensor histidine kinase [Ruminococcaceae bacterium]|nr:sensor histidine kinase [Oscillospiraceae bacterium]
MLEISLHILDIVNNSVRAGADLITLTLLEDKQQNKLSVEIADNGCGMDPDFLRSVTDPFRTTRTTRKVGMGLSLFKAAAETTGGNFSIESEKGKGTTVRAEFVYNHIDRQPLGDMAQTITTVLSGNATIDFVYRHTVDGRKFLLDTREIRQILGDVELSQPEVIVWLSDYITEGLAEIQQP